MLSRSLRFSLLVAVAATLWSPLVGATDAEGEESGAQEDERDEDEQLLQVSLRAHFMNREVDSAGVPRFPAGEPVDTLIGLENKEDQPYRVEFAHAYIRTATTPQYVIQNVSGAFYNRTVGSGETGTLVYKFTPAKEIDPRDYGLVLQVYIQDSEDSERGQLMTVFNGTVTITDSTSAVDFQGIFLAVLLCGLGYGFWKLSKKSKLFPKFGRSRSRSQSTGDAKKTGGQRRSGAKKGAIDEDFIPKEHLRAMQRSSGKKDK